tara:strand:- start:61 stop:660 length:600 start_codon:yes stop_codon:yes gene_type:complete
VFINFWLSSSQGFLSQQVRLSYQITSNTDPFSNFNSNIFNLKLSGDKNQNELAEKKMLVMIKEALLKKGWIMDNSNPDYFISVSFGIDDGKTSTRTGSKPVTTSRYDYQTKKTTYTTTQQAYSSTRTSYERNITIYIKNKKNELLWQGDLISKGSTQDVMFVAPHLIPHLVSYIGENDVSAVRFRHSCKKSNCPKSIRK